MVLKADQQRVRTLIKDTLTLLCKNGLTYRNEFCIEALIGITLDKDDVMLVSINETVQDGLEAIKVQSAEDDTCAPSPSLSDTARTKAHPSPRHTQSHDSGLSSSAQTSPRSPAKSSSSVGSKHDRDSSGGRKSPTDFGEPRRKRSRRKSSDSSSHRSSPNLESVKLEDSLPDGSSFMITTGDSARSKPDTEALLPLSETGYQEDSSLNTPPFSHPGLDEDSSDIVVIKDEVLSDTELDDLPSGLGESQGGHDKKEGLGVPSGRTEPLPGMSAWPTGMGSPGPSGAPYLDPSAAMAAQTAAAEGAMSQVWDDPQSPLLKPIHTEQGTIYMCLYCPLQSKWRTVIRRHMIAKHRSQAPHSIQCALCQAVYKNKSSLVWHMKQKHKDVCPGQMKCFKCDQTFHFGYELQTHMYSEHALNPQDFRFKCAECGNEYWELKTLMGHLASHPSVLAGTQL